jgi:hypothetical protein
MRTLLFCLAALPALLLPAGVGAQQGDFDLGARWREGLAQAFDPRDGQLDVSPILETAHGFLPIPIVITEPAVGYGGGLAALFIRPRREAGSEGYARPNISAVGAMATENGTKIAFGGDSSRWLDGRLKTLAGALAGDLRLDVYGLGPLASDLDEPVRYTLDIKAALGQIDWVLAPGSPWSVGLRLLYADVEPKLRDDPVFPNLDDRIRVRIAGPSIVLTYDSRDNVFTPTQGGYAETSWFVSDHAFGASRDFTRFGQILIGWWPVDTRVTVGARADYQQASDDAPFFARPFIAMRGIPAMRYPGNKVASTEVEARWQFHGRWSVVGFGGVGLARIDAGVKRDKTAAAGGIGFRYEIASKFGLHVGIDVARGPEDTAFYLQVGSAWGRP